MEATLFDGPQYEVRAIDGIEQVSSDQWNRLIEHSSLGSIFHRYEWLRAVEAGTNLEPYHLLVTKNTNPIGALPHFVHDIEAVPLQRLTSLKPGFGGPIISTDEERVLELLIDAAAELCEGSVVTHLLTSAAVEYARYDDYLIEAGYASTIENCRFVLDLTDGWESIYEGMDSSRRRGIQSGEEQAVSVHREEVTAANLRAFHREYRAVMDRVDGDAYPASLFAELASMADRILIVAAVDDGNPVGKHLYLLDEERSTVHHFFPGVRREYFDYHSSELIHKHTIKWGIRNGYQSFDFGSTTADFRDGLFKYKEGFGTRAVPTLSWERGTGVAGTLFQAGRSLYFKTSNLVADLRSE